MSERILIPLDGSKLGEVSLHYVEKLASRLAPSKGVEITLLQVVKQGTHHSVDLGSRLVRHVPYSHEEMENIKRKAMDYLDTVGQNLRRKGATVNCKVVVTEPYISSAEEIIKAEEDANIDMVAMSTHGRHGLSQWAFGSVTDKVLRSGKAPVLMIRTGKDI